VDIRYGFYEKIEEFYQASDVYIFPVRNPTGSIDLPLSVLEALAVGLPVVSTRFGAIADMVPKEAPIMFYNSDSDLLPALLKISELGSRTSVSTFPPSWEKVADEYVQFYLTLKSKVCL